MDPTWVQLSERLTVIGLLLFFIYGGVKEWWVFGASHKECRADRDYWRDQAVSVLTLAEGSLALAERKRRRTGGSD